MQPVYVRCETKSGGEIPCLDITKSVLVNFAKAVANRRPPGEGNRRRADAPRRLGLSGGSRREAVRDRGGSVDDACGLLSCRKGGRAARAPHLRGQCWPRRPGLAPRPRRHDQRNPRHFRLNRRLHDDRRLRGAPDPPRTEATTRGGRSAGSPTPRSPAGPPHLRARGSVLDPARSRLRGPVRVSVPHVRG